MKRRRVENEASLVIDEVEETQDPVVTTCSSTAVHAQLLSNAYSQLGVGSQISILKEQRGVLQKQIQELQKELVQLRISCFYLSRMGGRMSDLHLTEHSGLLQKLLPGDMILADRGFTIEDTVGLYCAEVKIPPFTRDKR